MQETFIPLLMIVAGVGVIVYSKPFARKAITQDNVFGRANAKLGENAVRAGPIVFGSLLVIGAFLDLVGVLEFG